MITILCGLIVVAFASIVFSITFIVSTSACELGTTSAQQGLMASGPIIGIIVGGVICGYLADKFGRRQVLLYALISGAIINAFASLSPNWIVLLIFQTIACFCAAGQYSLAMTLVSECVPILMRNKAILSVTSIFLLALGIMAVIAMPVIPLTFSIHVPALGIYWNSWRLLLLVYSLPSLIAAVWLYLMMESPKFMYVKGREQEAIEIIQAIYRINHGKSAEALNIKGLKLEAQSTGPLAPSKDQIKPLFTMPLLKYTFIVTSLFMCQQNAAFTTWLPSIANQFIRVVQTGEGTDKAICGILRDSRDIPVNPDLVPCSLNKMSLVFIMIICVLQSGCNILLILVVNRVGRRNMAIIITVVCGLSGIVTNLVPNAYASAIFFVIFMISILNMGLYTAIAVHIFPTHLRALAVALTLTGGRLVNFAAVQILKLLLEVNCDLGFYLFNSIFTASAIILAFLPDERYLHKKRKEENTEEESFKMLESKLSS
ncbi:niacin transporter NiaP-like isoform X2 [Battus philenor]|uniref:niacin transporter NiaP-like isoform X2 n=2 Tax=Battus philenor TaxID=42288 RepID=UPI0035D10CEA